MITIDFETYSEAGYLFDPALGHFIPLQKGKPGLPGINAAVYAAHPSTRLISLAYDGGLWVPGCHPPTALFEYIQAGGLVEAHNSGFEASIWDEVCVKRMGWPPVPPGQWRCSASKARAWSLPGGLGRVADVLQTGAQKDKRGAQLIRLLSVPKKPTKGHTNLRRSRLRYPDLYREMYEYNIQDVATEKAISAIMPELSDTELAVWQLDQKINRRGVQIDLAALADCISVYHQAERRYTAELVSITGGAVQTVGEITKGSAGDKWLISKGVTLGSLDKAEVTDALAGCSLPDDCRRVLEIRQILGSASVKKLFAMDRTVSADGRLRDLFIYCGADRSGRWAGRGPQPQNLKNSGPNAAACRVCNTINTNPDDPGCAKCGCPLVSRNIEWGNTTVEAARVTMATRNLEAVERQWGNALDIIASCMRSLFVGELICSDYSAIEAVVIAALAGEEWRLEVFRTHGKIYEASASRAFGVPLQEILDHKIQTGKHHPLRAKGKVRELANGYSSWISVSRGFGHPGTDEEIKADILAWRKESPAIVELWGGQWRGLPWNRDSRQELYGLEGAAVQAIQDPDQCYKYREIGFGYDTSVDVLYCLLPSSRKLAYHKPRLTRDTDPLGRDIWQISYMGTQDRIGWVRKYTYGGRLAATATQASARDILAAAMLRVEAAGYKIVLHVHDEIVAECPPRGSVEEFEKLMMVREPWFADWPIRAAGGWRGKRYRK